MYEYEGKYEEAFRNINCLDDYWNLLDSFPGEKSALYLSEKDFMEDKRKKSNPDWEVYINTTRRLPYFTFINKTDGEWTPEPGDKLLPKHCK